MFYLNKIHVSVWISQILNTRLCYEIWALGTSFCGDIRRGCDGVYIWIVNGTLAGETRVGNGFNIMQSVEYTDQLFIKT